MAMRTMVSKFAGTCSACGQRFAAGISINWEKGRGAQHTHCAAQAAPMMPAAPAAPTPVVAAHPIAAFLYAAAARGLKYPKVRFMGSDRRELGLTIAGAGSRYPGAIQVKADGLWIGRIMPDGSVAGPMAADAPLLVVLTTIAADPAAAARNYGSLSGRCSFCNLPLTDTGSIEVGYGPICAQHYGLPHHPKGTPALAPVVAPIVVAA